MCEQMTFLDGEDAFQLAISSSTSASAQRGLLFPRHEHCQLLLCTDRPTNLELSPKYSRCSHIHSPRGPRDHSRSSPGGGRFTGCALHGPDGLFLGRRVDVEQDYVDTRLQAFGNDCHVHQALHHHQAPGSVCGCCTGQHCSTHETSLCCQDIDFGARLNIRGGAAGGVPPPLQLSLGAAGGASSCPTVESARTQKQQTLATTTTTPIRYIDRTDQCSLIDCSAPFCHSMPLDFGRQRGGISAKTTTTTCNQIHGDSGGSHAQLETVGLSGVGGGGKGDGGVGGGRGGKRGGGGVCRTYDCGRMQSASRCSNGFGMESAPEKQSLRSIADAAISGDAAAVATVCDSATAAGAVEIEENAANEGRKVGLSSLSMGSGHLVMTTTTADDDADDDNGNKALRPPINPDLVFVTGTQQLLHGYV